MSFSLDMTAMFANASLIVNALWPIAAISVGFALGFSILNMVRKALKDVA